MPRARGGAGAGAGGVQVMNNAAELVARRKRTRGFLAGLEAEAASESPRRYCAHPAQRAPGT